MNHLNIPNRLLTTIKLLLLLIILNSADCSLKKEPTCHISEEFKSYIVFKEGSYWIYQNQSGNMDTIKIIRQEHSILDSPYNYPSERYTITTESNKDGSKTYFAQSEDLNMILCKSFSQYTTNYYYPVLFFCCCDPGSRVENLTFQSQLDSIEISGNWFFNVKVFESDSINPQTKKTLYYSKYIGLIMYEDFNDNTWQIINYSVSKNP